MIVNPFVFSTDSAFFAAGTDFDGTNDYMTHAAALTGATNGTQGILSVWFRIDGSDGSIMHLLRSLNGHVAVFRGATRMYVAMTNYGGTNYRQKMYTGLSYTASPTWHHLLASWDSGSTGNQRLYADDTSSKTTAVDSSTTLTYTDTNVGVGSDAGSNKWDGCLSEVYLALNQYLDFSVESNRRKFISATGKPVDLGADGSTPTGVAPTIYLHRDFGEDVTNFATNRGTGGDFAIVGSLDSASTHPSD